ncbi:MAG: NDP-mannose synthase, partial [Gaiellales bacterium]|nr:NDP-mannose synthase [Gaiellales bacterium]
MAGGRGERMRASGIDVPKPLVPVRGVPLIELGVRRLLWCGFTEIVVAVPGDGPVGRFAEHRLGPLASAAGARLRVYAEPEPLGNIGCAGMLRGEGDVLTVYADNVTSLDLRDVLRHHAESGAALTLAAHDEPFRLPYGRLDIEAGRVVGYSEKPAIAVTVSSAIAVLGSAATEVIPADRPTGLVDLTVELLRRGLPVAAYEHRAPWVDVNDAGGVRRAETLLD